MTGRTGHRTMEMNGGLRKSRSYLARTPCVPLFCTLFNRVGDRRVLDYQGRAGIISIMQWNLRPVIFGVETDILSKEFWGWAWGSQTLMRCCPGLRKWRRHSAEQGQQHPDGIMESASVSRTESSRSTWMPSAGRADLL